MAPLAAVIDVVLRQAMVGMRNIARTPAVSPRFCFEETLGTGNKRCTCFANNQTRSTRRRKTNLKIPISDLSGPPNVLIYCRIPNP